MGRELANRAVFVLACIGAFIALVIGVAHASGVQLPCGGVQSGCDVIGQPEHNQWFNIPIAFFGLALYLFVALGTFSRAVIGTGRSPNLGSAIWVLLAAGTIISIGLIAYAKVQLDATCLWCLSSAITMTLAFLVHSFGMSREPGAATRWPVGLYFALLLLAIGGGSGYGYLLSQNAKHVKVKPIVVPADTQIYLPTSHMTGDKNAPITIVEFGDMYCPLCRKMHKWMEEQMNGPLKGKVRLVFRHWPVKTQHPLAVDSAMLSEWAAEQGKFWEFVHAVQGIEDKEDSQALLKAVQQIGLDVLVAEKLLADPTARAKYLATVATDIGAGNKLGVESTPWWFIEYKDKSVEPASGMGIQGKVESEAFKKRLGE